MVSPTCRWATTNGCGHDLEAEYALGGGLLHPRAGERAESAALEVGGDASQHLGEVCAGAAAGVEYVDVVGGQPFGDAEIVLQGSVDAGYHVSDDLGGGVPDAELLAEDGVEGLQEGLVEVGDGRALAEPVEEGAAVDAVEGGGGPVQHLDQAQGLEPSGVGELLEERPQDGGAEVPDGGAPVERPGGRRGLAGPEHPGGEDAVEEGLHEGGPEEGGAALALEADTQGILQRGADGVERRLVARCLYAGQAVSRVGGEQPCEVPRLD